MAKEVKTNAMRILEKANIDFTGQSYECDQFVDGMETAKQLGLDPKTVYKTLVTIGKSKNYFVFIIPIEKELDLKKGAKAVGEKSIEMIPVKEITKVTGYIRGGCTAIGMKKQYQTVLHQEALELDKIWVSGGKVGYQIRLSPKDLLKVIGGEYAFVTKETEEGNE